MKRNKYIYHKESGIPCDNKGCSFYLKYSKQSCAGRNKEDNEHLVKSCTQYFPVDNMLVVDNSKHMMHGHGYSVKPSNVHEISMWNRFKAAWLVFTGRAYAHMWYDVKEIGDKLPLYYNEKVSKVDCINSECEGYDDSCSLNCCMSTAIFNMCGIYRPERRIK